MTDSWIQRVKQADAEAEAAWQILTKHTPDKMLHAHALAAIAAELRAQRIARRPGAGQ